MADLNETFVTSLEHDMVREWAKELGNITLETGHVFNLLDWVVGLPKDFNQGRRIDTYLLWVTPVYLDRWIYLNCPFPFIREDLRQKYSSEDLEEMEKWEWHDPKDDLRFGRQHYTFLKEPKKRRNKIPFNYNRQWARPFYYIDLISNDEFCYDSQTNNWSNDPFFPSDYENYCPWYINHRIPTKKSILRLLRSWYLPSGTIVHVGCSNIHDYHLEYKILVK